MGKVKDKLIDEMNKTKPIMRVEDIIKIEIDTLAVGKVLLKVPYNNETEVTDSLIVSIPNREFFVTDYTNLELIHIVERDVELFKKLNDRSDKEHQVYIDTLCLYGIYISGGYIRLQYWFHQDGDEDSHRMCAGVVTRHISQGNRLHEKDKVEVVFPECYPSDVCVYW